jgi:hypothetical protein
MKLCWTLVLAMHQAVYALYVYVLVCVKMGKVDVLIHFHINLSKSTTIVISL